MGKPTGEGRVWKKDIDYTDVGKRLYKVPHTKKATPGMNSVANSSVEKRPVKRES